jgi:hypothetical protein
VVFNGIGRATGESAEELYSGLQLFDDDPDMVEGKHGAIIAPAGFHLPWCAAERLGRC